MDTKEYLSNYYEQYDEDGRLLSKHGKIEYITTMKYIEKYLQPGMIVLEIGAATGRYSHALAQKDYRVDAVEGSSCPRDQTPISWVCCIGRWVLYH